MIFVRIEIWSLQEFPSDWKYGWIRKFLKLRLDFRIKISGCWDRVSNSMLPLKFIPVEAFQQICVIYTKLYEFFSVDITRCDLWTIATFGVMVRRKVRNPFQTEWFRVLKIAKIFVNSELRKWIFSDNFLSSSIFHLRYQSLENQSNFKTTFLISKGILKATQTLRSTLVPFCVETLSCFKFRNQNNLRAHDVRLIRTYSRTDKFSCTF